MLNRSKRPFLICMENVYTIHTYFTFCTHRQKHDVYDPYTPTPTTLPLLAYSQHAALLNDAEMSRKKSRVKTRARARICASFSHWLCICRASDGGKHTAGHWAWFTRDSFLSFACIVTLRFIWFTWRMYVSIFRLYWVIYSCQKRAQLHEVPSRSQN